MKVVDSYAPLSGEKGTAMFEAVIVMPILIMLFLFLVDFAIYTKAQTHVTQVMRDAAIYLATSPSPLTDSGWSNLQSSGSMLATCHAEPYKENCGHYITHQRISMMLGTQFNNHIDQDSLSIFTSSSGKHVSVQISVPVAAVFMMDGMTISRTANLRKVG